MIILEANIVSELLWFHPAPQVVAWMREIQEDVASTAVTLAELFGSLVGDRERQGKPIGFADLQIAAICLTRGATLPTRNTKNFHDGHLRLVNPWMPPHIKVDRIVVSNLLNRSSYRRHG